MDLRSTLLNYILNALFRDTPTCLPFVTSRHVTYVTHVTRVTHMTHDTQVADRPNMCYIFEKVMVQGPQKQGSQVSYILSRDVTSRHICDTRDKRDTPDT